MARVVCKGTAWVKMGMLHIERLFEERALEGLFAVGVRSVDWLRGAKDGMYIEIHLGSRSICKNEDMSSSLSYF